jgi:hypothetical protein
MSVTQPFQVAPQIPAFVVGPDQIQPANTAVSADGATFLRGQAPPAKPRKAARKPPNGVRHGILRQITSPERSRVGTALRIISH